MRTQQICEAFRMVCLALACLLACESSLAFADTPISNTTYSHFCSSDRRFCATSKQTPPLTTVFEKGGQSQKPLWSTPAFIPVGFLSTDGKVLASCYPGLNLVPEDAGLDFVVVKVYLNGQEIQIIQLSALYKHADQLVRTESHRDWGHCVGFRNGLFVIKRADGSLWKKKLGR